MRRIVAIIFLITFLIVAVLPIATMLSTTFFNGQTLNFKAYETVLQNIQNWRILGNSLALALLTALLALLIGIPLSYLLTKTDLPFKKFLTILLIIPLFLPPYILSISWTHILGKQGLFQTWFSIGSYTSNFLFSLYGAAFVLANTYFPLVLLICMAAFYGIDSSFEDEARQHIGERKIFSSVLLPLIFPFIKAAFLFVFIFALSEFGVAAFLGTDVYTVEILTQFSAFYDFRAATAHATILVLIAFIIVLFTGKLFSRISSEILESLLHADFRIIKLNLWKWPLFMVICGMLTLLVLLPLGILVYKSLPFTSYIQAFQLAYHGIFNSLLWAGVGSTMLVLFGFIFSYQRIRHRWQFIDSITLFSFAIPGTVLGIGLISLWNRDAPFAYVYQSILLVIFGYIARFTFIAENVISGAISQIPISFEEAAQLEGGNWLKIFSKIIFPLSKPAIIATWILGFIFCFGEIGTTLLVYPPGSSTLPITIYTISANSPENLAAALCVLLIGIILISLALLFMPLKSFQK